MALAGFSAASSAPLACAVASASGCSRSRRAFAPSGSNRDSAAAAAAAAASVDIKPGDEELHKKAKRFAKLLIDEIKLYNQAKVNEGRKNKDLYDRLKEDIDKSRGTYTKRYGSTVAASGDYFQREVVRSLAEDDLSVMGANFKK